MRKGGLQLPPAFQNLILITWSASDSNLVIISSLDSKWQGLKFGMPVFQLFYEMKLKTSKFKLGIFKASENIMTKFKSQALYVIRIKYWKAGGSGNPPSLIPALWNIGILLNKQATQTKHFDGQCCINGRTLISAITWGLSRGAEEPPEF